MMRFWKSIGIAAGLFFLSACGGRDVPKGILEKEKMEAVMWDMMQADEFLKEFVLAKDTSLDKADESAKLYQRVFEIHGTDRFEFAKSFDYYRTHTKLIKEIMDSLNLKSATPSEVVAPVTDTIPVVADSSKIASDSVAPKPDTLVKKKLKSVPID